MITSTTGVKRADAQKDLKNIPTPKSGVKLELFHKKQVLSSDWGKQVTIPKFNGHLPKEMKDKDDNMIIAEKIFLKDLLCFFYKKDALRFLKELHSCLEPGGTIEIVNNDIRKIIQKYTQLLNYKYLDMFYSLEGAKITSGYTPEILSIMLEEAGFVAIEVITVGEYIGSDLNFTLKARKIN